MEIWCYDKNKLVVFRKLRGFDKDDLDLFT